MAQRITELELREIVDMDSAFDPTTFIDTAVAMVDTYLASKPSLSTTMLKQIELYLAAHYYAVYDRQAKSERADDVQVTYFGGSGIGLKFTPYGQQAVAMDVTGTLDRLDKGNRTPNVWHIG